MSEYKVGDRVKVTIEGTVSLVASTGTLCVDQGDPDGGALIPPGGNVAIERVVETFKAGDRVRSKVVPRLEYTIGVGGYYSHEFKEWRAGSPASFASDDFELVYRSPEATP